MGSKQPMRVSRKPALAQSLVAVRAWWVFAAGLLAMAGWISSGAMGYGVPTFIETGLWIIGIAAAISGLVALALPGTAAAVPVAACSPPAASAWSPCWRWTAPPCRRCSPSRWPC